MKNYLLGCVLGLMAGLIIGSTVTHNMADRVIHRMVAQDQAINEISQKITEQAKAWKQRAESCEAGTQQNQAIGAMELQGVLLSAAQSEPHTLMVGPQTYRVTFADAAPASAAADPLEMLNAVRPGLGTAAVAIKRAAQAAQTKP
jgi:hypothetical protein